MSEALNKAIQVYKNQGLVGVAKKSRSTLKYRAQSAKRKLVPFRETLEQQELREEYNVVSNPVFQITSEDIELSKQVSDGPAPAGIKTATWFVPYYDHFGFNGIQTIFRFIEKLSQEGVT